MVLLGDFAGRRAPREGRRARVSVPVRRIADANRDGSLARLAHRRERAQRSGPARPDRAPHRDPGADRETATRVAERIRRAIERTRLDIGGGHGARRTASFGVVTAEPSDDDLEELVLRAQVLQFPAKEEGRDRIAS
jgi:GGDEF domain-containing protein